MLAAGPRRPSPSPSAAPQPPPHRRTAACSLGLLLAGCSAGFDWQGRERHGLADYQRAFARDLGRSFDSSATWSKFTGLLRYSRVLWLGDHHRDPLLHDRQQRLLQRLHQDGFRLALCVEALGQQDEPALADYLRGNIELPQLRDRVRARWPGSWLETPAVDHEHYLALLRLARSSGWPVSACEPAPRLPLAQRDGVIAAAARRMAERHPDRLLVVVVGQAHLLGHGQLPARTALPFVALGAEPTAALRAAVPRLQPGQEFLRSSGGLWFFTDLLPVHP
jgi:hypothetical protein